jgi:ABC-2 type transport system permease protein
MFSKKIANSSIKTNSVFISIIIVSVIASIVSLVAIYPSMTSNSSYAKLLSVMPQQMLDAIGMKGDVTDLNDYLNMNFYNSVYLYIMMAFTIIFVAKLVAKPIGDTSLVYYLNSSVSRKKFLRSQIVVFNIGLFLVLVSSVISGIVSKIIIVGDVNFNIENLLRINIAIVTLFFLVGAICFFISTLVNNNSEALTYSTSLIIFEYILDMFRKISSKLDIVKYFTIFTVFDTDKICNDNIYFVSSCLIMVVVAIVIYIISLQYFNGRDLYL